MPATFQAGETLSFTAEIRTPGDHAAPMEVDSPQGTMTSFTAKRARRRAYLVGRIR